MSDDQVLGIWSEVPIEDFRSDLTTEEWDLSLAAEHVDPEDTWVTVWLGKIGNGTSWCMSMGVSFNRISREDIPVLMKSSTGEMALECAKAWAIDAASKWIDGLRKVFP